MKAQWVEVWEVRFVTKSLRTDGRTGKTEERWSDEAKSMPVVLSRSEGRDGFNAVARVRDGYLAEHYGPEDAPTPAHAGKPIYTGFRLMSLTYLGQGPAFLKGPSKDEEGAT